jgi:hypothetical protein
VAEYVSSCVLDGLATTIWIERARARSLFPPWAEPIKLKQAPSGKYPIFVEAWRVHAGRMLLAAGDHHGLAARWGALAGMSLGATVGLLGGPLVALATSQRASQAFRDLYRSWSEEGGAPGSNYEEVAITLPARLRFARDRRTYAFVLGMFTDSPVALWGDLALRCGYRKQLAHIAWPTARRCEVQTLTGELICALEWWGNAPIVPMTHASSALLAERTSAPLLGGLDGRHFAVSRLERVFDAAGARSAAVTASITLARGFAEGLGPLSASVQPLSRAAPWGAFCFADVPTRLAYPEMGNALGDRLPSP